MRFGFHLEAAGCGPTMRIERWWLGPLRLPIALAPCATAREWDADERFHFDVEIALPLIGLIVIYCGWLRRDTNQPVPS